MLLLQPALGLRLMHAVPNFKQRLDCHQELFLLLFLRPSCSCAVSRVDHDDSEPQIPGHAIDDFRSDGRRLLGIASEQRILADRVNQSWNSSGLAKHGNRCGF